MVRSSFAVSALVAAVMSISTATAATSPTGCGFNRTVNFTDGLKIQSGNRTRSYAIYVPPDYNTNSSLPRKLIFDYHGHGQTPALQYQNSKYYAFPGGNSYLAVYPAGLNKSWEGASYATPNVSDLKFTSDLLDYIEANYCVDVNRVYASGKSNGGGFVDTLACSRTPGDRFAAFAMASAAMYTDGSLNACTTRRAIIESHGGNDTVIPYAGCQEAGNEYCPEEGGVTPNVRRWIGWWGERNGCSADARNTTQKTNYQIQTYSCNGLAEVVKHYYIPALGHCWPSSDGNNTDGSKSECRQASDHVLDYTPPVLDFYSRWTLQNAPKQIN